MQARAAATNIPHTLFYLADIRFLEASPLLAKARLSRRESDLRVAIQLKIRKEPHRAKHNRSGLVGPLTDRTARGGT